MATFFLIVFMILTSSTSVVNSRSLNQIFMTPSQSPSSSAPSSTADCSSIIYGMASCMTFLSEGSNDTTPDPTCCSGLKSVLKVNAECICVALKSSADLGIDLNMTQAMSLPSACGVSAPSISQCGISSSPGAGPVPSPVNPPAASPQAPEAALPEAPLPEAPEASVPVSPDPSMPVSPPAEAEAPGPSPADGGSVAIDQAPSPSKHGDSCSLSASLPVIIISMTVASISII